MPTFLTPLNLTQQEIQNAVAQNLAAAPGSPKKGQFYMDTVANTLYWWSGTSWVAAQGSAPSFASPGASAVGDVIAAGVSTSGARADHVHGREAFGAVTAATTYGITAANGTALTIAHSDHTHGTPATPTATAVGAVANTGGAPNLGSGVTGSRPAAGNLGAMYLDSTTFLLYRDNGTTWDQVDQFGTPGASAFGDTVAAGTATTYARSDHKHSREAAGTPGSSAVGDAAAGGAATTIARSDHTHGREAFGSVTAATTFGIASSNGVAVTIPRSDHTHGTPAVPTPAAVGAVSSGGGTVPLISAGATGSRPAAGNNGNLYLDTTTFLIYRDNGTTWDQIDGFGTPGNSAVGDVAAAGAATTFARSNHVHGRESFGVPTNSAVGDSAATGGALTVANANHVHGREAFGNVVAQTAFGASSGNGVATTEARADHVHGTPTHVNADHSAITLNSLASPTAAVNMGAQKITNMADPTANTDAATKQYVDATAAGIDFKGSVRAASTANVTVASALINGLVMDGTTLATGDRVLLKNQTAPAENGIWIVAAAGAASRATDMDSTAEFTAGAITYVETGTVNGTEQWVMTTTGVITVGTTANAWTQFSGASTLTAGGGLTATGNVFAVGAGAGIVVAADTVSIDTAVVTRKFAVVVGDGASTSIVVTHNLGTTDVQVALYAAGTPFAEVVADVQHTSTNTITLIFAVAPAASAYRCVVLG